MNTSLKPQGAPYTCSGLADFLKGSGGVSYALSVEVADADPLAYISITDNSPFPLVTPKTIYLTRWISKHECKKKKINAVK